MSISYSGLTSYGKASMPSVESWGTNMNILKDPPKSLYTRRIVKVGQTSEITEMIDESGNRNAECILPFARGVNPMVSVSYQNNGKGANVQASLPYKVHSDAFRPPVRTQYDLLPLSRLPRVWTTAFSKPGFVDFSKKMRQCGNAQNTKETKNQILKKSVHPTAVYKIETPLKAPMETKYAVNETLLKKSYTAPISTSDNTMRINGRAGGHTRLDALHASAQTNLGINRDTSQGGIDTSAYVQDNLLASAHTNLGINRDMSQGGIDASAFVQDSLLSSAHTNASRPLNSNAIDYFHDLPDLQRTIPEYSATTNIRQNQDHRQQHEYQKELERVLPMAEAFSNTRRQGDTNVSARETFTRDRPSRGGFDPRGQMPKLGRIQELPAVYESDKSVMDKKVSEMMSRYAHPRNFQ